MSLDSIQTRRQRGFSLIEVLIAVLVLATGMLALAALQSALIRNSVDAKSRSQAMSIAIDTVERVRQSSGATITDYNDLPSGTSNWAAWVPPGGAAGSGANSSATYESRQTVTRFVRDSNSAVCGGANKTPCFRVAGADDGPQSGVAEFKRIDIEVRWTDAQGSSRSVTTSDIVGTVTDEKTDAILDQTGKPSTGVGEPVSRIAKPSEAGIIPIAVGDGKETAASNPKPITGRERGRTDETQFQVLTYSVEDGDVARLNRVIDTRVIGCRCSQQPANVIVDKTTLEGTPVQATFWDGVEYSVPEDVADINDGDRGQPIADAVQSKLCTTCCLDHHDRASNAVKLDPFRSDEYPHKHFYDPDETDFEIAFKESAPGDEYYEVCRMIRVNGIFRVATDMHLDLMNMLETDPTANESLPASSKIPRYQAMVKDYVDQRMVQNISNPDLSSFSDVLIDPEVVKMETDTVRYMHNRGLYIDYLEAPAVAALANALTTCPNGKPKVECALAVLPFVSINTTDIAQWSSEFAESTIPLDHHLTVSNWALRPECAKNDPNCLLPPPARGATTAIADGEEDVLVSMQVSNSGVSDSFPIDPQDGNLSPYAGQIANDAQQVLVDGGCKNLPSGSFKVNISGTDFTIPQTLQQMKWVNDAAIDTMCGGEKGGLCPGATQGGTKPNPFSCTTGFTLPTDPLGADVSVQLAGYNRVVDPNATPQNDKIADPCSTKSNPPKIGRYICEDWDIDTVTIGGIDAKNAVTYSNPGAYAKDLANLGEGASINLKRNLLIQGSTVDLHFVLASRKLLGATCVSNQVIYETCP